MKKSATDTRQEHSLNKNPPIEIERRTDTEWEQWAFVEQRHLLCNEVCLQDSCPLSKLWGDIWQLFHTLHYHPIHSVGKYGLLVASKWHLVSLIPTAIKLLTLIALDPTVPTSIHHLWSSSSKLCPTPHHLTPIATRATPRNFATNLATSAYLSLEKPTQARQLYFRRSVRPMRTPTFSIANERRCVRYVLTMSCISDCSQLRSIWMSLNCLHWLAWCSEPRNLVDHTRQRVRITYNCLCMWYRLRFGYCTD